MTEQPKREGLLDLVRRIERDLDAKYQAYCATTKKPMSFERWVKSRG